MTRKAKAAAFVGIHKVQARRWRLLSSRLATLVVYARAVLRRQVFVKVLSVFFLLNIASMQRGLAQNTINVDNASQAIPSGGCSLREAIYSANFDNNLAIKTTNPDVFVTTGCAAGSGDDN